MSKIRKASALLLVAAIVLSLASCGDESESPNKVGDIVKFGDYDWLVLDVKKDKTLIISVDILEKRAYNDEFDPITWEECTLRQYLNDEFFNSFSEADRARIIETNVTNSDSPYGTPGGNATTDMIFLLSIREFELYFIAEDISAIAIDSYGDAAWWWLRSPGRGSNGAAFIDSEGIFDYEGDYVSFARGGVRPAMWIAVDDAFS